VASPDELELRRQRGWWITHMERTDEGSWDVRVQFYTGAGLQLFLESQPDLDLVLEQAVAAHINNDLRWHKLSEPQ
jgi:hypothetical protein